MPWIDPAKEALAWLTLVKAGFASEVEVIRKRGQSPESLLEQVDLWRKKCEAKGLTFDSNAGLELLLKEAATDKEAPAEARAQAQAMIESVRSGVLAMSQREPMAVNVAAPIVNVAAAEAPPAPAVKLEHHTHIANSVEPPPAPAVEIHNHVDVPQAQVVVQPAVATRQKVTYKPNGDVDEIVHLPIDAG
jgi:hypothetical protein